MLLYCLLGRSPLRNRLENGHFATSQVLLALRLAALNKPTTLLLSLSLLLHNAVSTATYARVAQHLLLPNSGKAVAAF
jgi:hypothetical protein